MKPRKVKRSDGTYGWEIRWREGGRHRSRTLNTRAEAVAVQDEIRRRKRLGTLAQMNAGDMLLVDFVEHWWQVRAQPRLAPTTRRRYAQVWDSHIGPYLGDRRLGDLRPGLIEQWAADLDRAGVGKPTQRKALFMLQAVLRHAALEEHIPENPVKLVEKPRQRSRTVQPLAPEAVEAIRSELAELRDRTIVSVLAYGGLRPLSEALRLPWQGVRDRTLLVEAPKTHTTRTVKMLAPLAQDLAEWRLHEQRPGRGLVFTRRDGEAWRETDFRNWRRRVFRPACERAGLSEVRPYDLRHSFVSLLIQEGNSVPFVAAQAGHSPQECLRTYMHVFEGFDPADRTPAEERIRAVRQARVREMYG